MTTFQSLVFFSYFFPTLKAHGHCVATLSSLRGNLYLWSLCVTYPGFNPLPVFKLFNCLVSIISRNLVLYFFLVYLLANKFALKNKGNSFVGNGRQQNCEEAKTARAATESWCPPPPPWWQSDQNPKDIGVVLTKKCRNPNGVAVKARTRDQFYQHSNRTVSQFI